MTWEKILIEINQLDEDSWEALAPLLIATDHLLNPTLATAQNFRRLHFLVFELFSRCEGLGENERFEKLLDFFFIEKSFQFQDVKSLSEWNLSLSEALTQFSSHPFVGTLLFLHLAHSLQIALLWIQSKNQSILKWVRGERCDYVDLLCGGKKLTDNEVLKICAGPDSCIECWTPKDLYKCYLDLITQALESTSNPKTLLLAYSLAIQMDDSNTHLLGRRAFLRHRLGYTKEAHADLKRYFSFVEQSRAPFEIVELYHRVLEGVEQSTEIPGGPGPIYH
jgi:hypothetical protein